MVAAAKFIFSELLLTTWSSSFAPAARMAPDGPACASSRKGDLGMLHGCNSNAAAKCKHLQLLAVGNGSSGQYTLTTYYQKTYYQTLSQFLHPLVLLEYCLCVFQILVFKPLVTCCIIPLPTDQVLQLAVRFVPMTYQTFDFIFLLRVDRYWVWLQWRDTLVLF